MSDFEKRLRASLHRHAAEAPDGDRLVERVLRDTSALPVPSRRRRRREWRTWTLPLATAGAVAAIAAALVGVNQVHHSAAPAGSTSTTPNTPLLTPAPTGAPQDTAVPTLAPTAAPAVPPSLTNVRVLDATFVGPKDGWLLAHADCLNKPGTCIAMLRTVDGGAHWTSMSPPPANVPGVENCAAPCVLHLRFATSSIGYAYGDGPSGAFFMTTNGGKTWTQEQDVSVTALETLDGNVIRVSSVPVGCVPPGCGYAVQTAGIGSSKWTSRSLPQDAGGMTTGAQLVRGGHDAYLLVTGHPAGGAQNATSTLFVSTDDGATWSDRGEPCPQAGGPNGEVDSVAVAAGGNDRVSVLCVARMSPQPRFVAVSSDAGRHFTRRSPVSGVGAGMLAGDPSTVLLVVGPGLHRSADGGLSWQTLPEQLAAVTWVGFESTTDGRIISDAGRTIWTTHDAGAHWTPFTFG